MKTKITHRLAITVFVDVQTESDDYVDAAHVAEITIRRALAKQTAPKVYPQSTPFELDRVKVRPNGTELPPVRVHDVVETGMAAGNGYMWMRPTKVAYRAADDDNVLPADRR